MENGKKQMQNGKKVILYSILALTIGIASIAPLTIFESVYLKINNAVF
jgi:hypothetical protein